MRHFRNRPFPGRPRGFSLMEVVIVLMIAGLVLAGVWAAAGAVGERYRDYRLNRQIMIVAQNVVERYGIGRGRLPVATGDFTGQAVTDQQIPAEMQVGGGAVAHVWGGAFALNALSDQQFEMQMQGLNQGACSRLLMRLPILSPEMRIAQVQSANGGQTTGPINLMAIANPVPAANPAGLVLPFDLATSLAWCPNANNNQINIAFNL